MDLKEFKRIAAYARKSGIKKCKVGDIEIEFNEQPIRKAIIDDPVVPQFREPTLDDINKYIYETNEDTNHDH